MPLYNYKAKNSAGEVVTGSIEAATEDAVVSHLDTLGFYVLHLEVAKSAKSQSTSFFNFAAILSGVKKQDAILFTRQLSTLLRSGLSLAEALNTMVDQASTPRFKAVLNDISQSVQSGNSLSQSFAKYPAVFSELYVNMVKVGETAGILDMVLDRLALLGTQEMEITSRVKSALLYPIMLLVISIAVVSFLVIGILPKFALVFTSSQMNLPLPTQFILGTSAILQKLWWVLILLAVFAAFFFKGWLSSEKNRYQFHNLLLKFPIFGPLYAKIQIARFSRTLAALISCGVPLMQALSVVEEVISNLAIKSALQNIRRSISEGKSLVEPFKASGLFSPMVIQMISTGEQTGDLEGVLKEIAGFYEPEIERTIKDMTTVLEPMMLLGMGIVVAFIALSVLLPMFDLIKVFKN